MSYTPANYMISLGTTLGHATTIGGTYTLVADILEVDPPGVERDKSNATNLSSTRETTLPGWIKETTAKFTCYFLNAQVTVLYGFMTAGTILFWKVTYPLEGGQTVSGDTWVWPGYLTKFEPSKIVQLSSDHLTYDVEIPCLDNPTFTAGS